MAADWLVWAGWLGLFAVFEGLALSRHVPWTTLSEFAWALERKMPIVRWVFLIGLAVLMTHIVTGWPS